jgi:hypothetical protein
MKNVDLEACNNGLFGGVRMALNSFIDKMELEQSKINKAFFDSLSKEQRDLFCQSLKEQGVKPSRIEKITGKSQSTVNRHLNA